MRDPQPTHSRTRTPCCVLAQTGATGTGPYRCCPWAAIIGIPQNKNKNKKQSFRPDSNIRRQQTLLQPGNNAVRKKCIVCCFWPCVLPLLGHGQKIPKGLKRVKDAFAGRCRSKAPLALVQTRSGPSRFCSNLRFWWPISRSIGSCPLPMNPLSPAPRHHHRPCSKLLSRCGEWGASFTHAALLNVNTVPSTATGIRRIFGSFGFVQLSRRWMQVSRHGPLNRTITELVQSCDSSPGQGCICR